MSDFAESSFGDAILDQDVEDDSSDLGIDISQRALYTQQADPEIESLHGKFQRGKLVVQPDFQRKYVWDATKASRLIESALLEIPLPMVYISEEKDGREYVIDGQQRLTSFFSFIDGKFPDGRDFRLTGLKVFPELNRKLYRDLDSTIQDQIRYYHVRTITFKKESRSDLKFEVFERLNTGSVSLNAQELRNCIYRGKFNDLVKELARDPDFVKLVGSMDGDRRMRDSELVLRFMAFQMQTYLNYHSPMKRFLNTVAEQERNISDEKSEFLRRAFKSAVGSVLSVFGANAFKRFHRGSDANPNGYWETKQFNASLFDVEMFWFARYDRNLVYKNLDAIREAMIELMSSDQEFIDSIELSTSSVQAVNKRFEKMRVKLEPIIALDSSEPRLFSRDLRRSLFEDNPSCGICGQQIHTFDDAAVDHIVQYALGGSTSRENARLAHRFCNWSRSRNDFQA